MAIPELVDEYFCDMLTSEVNDYIGANEYDEDTDFESYMEEMGSQLCNDKYEHYSGQTDLEICDDLQDPDLFEEIMKYAKDCGCREKRASHCFTEVYAIYYDKYVKGWEEADLKETNKYLAGRWKVGK